MCRWINPLHSAAPQAFIAFFRTGKYDLCALNPFLWQIRRTVVGPLHRFHANFSVWHLNSSKEFVESLISPHDYIPKYLFVRPSRHVKYFVCVRLEISPKFKLHWILPFLWPFDINLCKAYLSPFVRFQSTVGWRTNIFHVKHSSPYFD